MAKIVISMREIKVSSSITYLWYNGVSPINNNSDLCHTNMEKLTVYFTVTGFREYVMSGPNTSLEVTQTIHLVYATRD